METEGIRRRRKEVGLALLLWLVAWELPLNTVAAAASTVPVPPPEASNASGSDDGFINANNLWTDLFGTPFNKFMNLAAPVVRAFRAAVGRLTDSVFGWFCFIWQRLMELASNKVIWVIRCVLTTMDPQHLYPLTDPRPYIGFIRFLFDVLRYPWKWVRAVMLASPFGYCFTHMFQPCFTKYVDPPFWTVMVFCSLKFIADCDFFDNFRKTFKPFPWPVFRFYRTPPGRNVPLPF